MNDGLPLVGVIGAGTMGAGIAQVAALAGHRVLLADAVDGAAGRAVDRIRDRVKAQVAKGRLQADPDALDITPATIAPSSAPGLAGLAGLPARAWSSRRSSRTSGSSARCSRSSSGWCRPTACWRPTRRR